ncbi:hypothetical protein D8Y22_10980 [Salinadaptatus halalkaliphilus]|uniref:Presenilin-like membrane protease, A22 family n=1 Tax=Salinadaptatus halalkaliphilus TaxID=2419781 RepID=A0A4S3TNH1_9EURY|nr:presenilin family intramembrane aspartyl protease PSH [Salinadaptatus halalkaliphilus]THE64773.1 hypothetical protein D8Y22_10980 [Salinadaptatus halalkaliphilus]
MNDRIRVFAAVGFTVLLFLGVQFGSLALIEPFYESDRQAVDDPQNPTNSAVYFGIILVATAFMLAAFKYDLQWTIRGLIVGVSVMLSWFVFTELVPPAVTVGGANVLAVLGALIVGLALLVYPEWYVIDLSGVLMGAGAAALFGISFGLLPALLLLTALAIYDAISVYGTEHMLDLAEGVMDLKIPVILIVPTSLSYSYLSSGQSDGGMGDEELAPAETDSAADGSSPADASAGATTDAESVGDDERSFDRDALYIGLGDAVIPSILVVSAAFFLDAGALEVPGLLLNVPALGALIGTIAGLLVLMYMVLEGRAHAGLPLLNGGAIGGYLVGALASGLSLATALGL